MLWQFPPQQRLDVEPFAVSFQMLPHDAVAMEMARGCSEKMLPRSVLETNVDYRFGMCWRSATRALRRWTFFGAAAGCGLVVANTVEWPLLLDVTSDLAYVGLHGSEQLCASSYSDAEGEVWARRAVQWAAGETPAAGERAWLVDEEAAAVRPRDVFVYFDNDAKVHAPFDAEDLRRKVDGRWGRRSSDRRWRGIRARRGFAGRREGRSAGRRARCPSGRRCRCALRQRRGFCRRAG